MDMVDLEVESELPSFFMDCDILDFLIFTTCDGARVGSRGASVRRLSVVVGMLVAVSVVGIRVLPLPRVGGSVRISNTSDGGAVVAAVVGGSVATSSTVGTIVGI